MHGMTKFQLCMKRYGSAINFYGGPGEAAHKFFVKVPGHKTQRRVSKFAAQTANHCYDIMVTKHAIRSIGMEMDWVVVQRKNINIDHSNVVTESDDLSVTFLGKYRLVVTNNILKSMKANDNVYITWLWDKKNIKKNNNKLCLNKDLVRVLLRKISDIGDTDRVGDITVTRYTRATINMDNSSRIILYAHPCFQGNPRYNWAYVHFQEVSPDGIEVENYYLSCIIGFNTLQGISEAMIQCAEKPLLWSAVETNFSRVKIGTLFEVSFVAVPVSALVHPLCLIHEFFTGEDTFMVVLPKQNWSCYYSDNISIP
jgi:hypothetical protein